MDDTKANILGDIDRVGWSVMNVYGAGEGQPDYAYTIGLQRYGWPEFYAVGLPAAHAGTILNNAVREVRDRQATPIAAMPLAAVLDGYMCRLDAPAADVDQHMGFALWLAEHDGGAAVRFLQLAWPDRVGLLPDDPACQPSISKAQRL